jgi:4-amino-4-deoxy-L-arabinose transferase-like glycosyltransferase
VATLLLSLALIYLVFALGRNLAPERPWAAVAAAGTVAFLPMHLQISATIGNDVLSEVCAAAALLLLALYLRGKAEFRGGKRDRPPGVRALLGVGIAIGLGMLTKSISVLLFPVAWVGAALGARHPNGYRWRQLIRDAAAITVPALVISGWWLARNQTLYGDFLAQGAFLDAFQGLRPSPQSFMEAYNMTSTTAYVGLVVIWTAASVTGIFGPVEGNQFLFFPVWVYVAAGVLAVTAALGFARYWRHAKLADWQREIWAVWLLFAALLLASFVRFNLSFFQAQARYLFPALPAAALAFCLGLQQLAPAAWRSRVVVLCVVLLAILASAGTSFFILPRLGPS